MIRSIFPIAIIYLCLGLLLEPAFAGTYTPVDQLGHASPTVNTGKQLSRKLQRQPKAREQASQRSYVTDSGKIKLFGTVEFPKSINSHTIWLDMLKRNSKDPIFILGRHFNKSTTWAKLKGDLEGHTPMEQLKKVNTFWNVWPYREDIANWHMEDYWAIPAEFLVKSGDCEDYAITKYFTLKEIGFDPEKMRIVVLRDTVRNLAHAVLAVYLDNDVYILDNLSNMVLSHKRMLNYMPQYSVNEFGRWAHIPTRKKG